MRIAEFGILKAHLGFVFFLDALPGTDQTQMKVFRLQRTSWNKLHGCRMELTLHPSGPTVRLAP